jgi:S1-C subfamily serine protease
MANLHLEAAIALFNARMRDQAAEHCASGLAYFSEGKIDLNNPTNLTTREWLLAIRKSCKNRQGTGIGTGFCVAPGGYILTNAHVVEGAREVQVQLFDVDELVKAHVVHEDRTTDIALLEIDDPARDRLTPIPLTDRQIVPGRDVCALGFQEGSFNTARISLTKGSVSAVLPEGVQLDCTINRGTSGGPLLDARGAAVGMAFGRTKSSPIKDSFGAAIHAAKLREFLDGAASHAPKLREFLDGAADDKTGVESTDDLPFEDVYRLRAPSVVRVLNVQ